MSIGRKPVVMCNTGRGSASSSSGSRTAAASSSSNNSSNEAKRWKMEKSHTGTQGEREREVDGWVRAAAKKHGDTKGIHASSEQQQHKHGTAQASEQGAEGGGGVLT